MNRVKRFYPLYTALFVFIIYLTTIAPSVIQIDAGELAAVQSTLGIAHPTGYPLFTLSGYLFSLLPLPFTNIFKLNLLSALWCAAGTGIFVYTIKFTFDNISSLGRKKSYDQPKPGKKKKGINKEAAGKVKPEKESLPENKKILAAVLGGLILAFSRTFWFQSTSVEVYSLHIFILSLIILFLIRAAAGPPPEKIISLNWFLFSFFMALGFTNHMTTLLVIPGALYLFFSTTGINKKSLKSAGILALIALSVVILFYSYLPFRASQEPAINWGNPVDAERIWRHISGKQYQVWLFSSAGAAKKQLIYFINILPSEFLTSLFLAGAGIFISFIQTKRIGIFLLVSFLFTVIYSINYDINDIDSYFLLAYISLAFFSAYGIIWILSSLKFRRYSYSIAAMVLSLFIVLQIYINRNKVDQSGNYVFEDYTKALIGSTAGNSVIFGYQWDYCISPSYYFQFVENFRRDAAIIDKELLRRSWYFKQLEITSPGLLKGVKNETELFLKALAPFEQGKNFNSGLLETLYRRLMTNLVLTNIEKRNFYVMPELFENEMQRGEFVLPEGYRLVPDLFLFRVVKGNQYVPAEMPEFSIRFPENRNFYINHIEQRFAGPMLARRALYELQFDKVGKAKAYVKKIRKDFPGYRLPDALAVLAGE